MAMGRHGTAVAETMRRLMDPWKWSSGVAIMRFRIPVGETV